MIGPGGTGIGSTGGGSGAVTTWYGAAQHVPNTLYVVAVGQGSPGNSQIYFDQSQVRVLLTAEGGLGAVAGVATPAGPFAASGFYQSVAGQAGSISVITASTTTFLSGGADANTETVTANYGYVVPGDGAGFFQMQPIIVGAGGSAVGVGGIGCGGGGGAAGGPGLVLIASW